jgi:hypothetical protein
VVSATLVLPLVGMFVSMDSPTAIAGNVIMKQILRPIMYIM